MTVITRDAWSDAHQAATAEVLDPDVAAVRRRLRLRSAMGLGLGLVALLGALWLTDFVIDADAEDVWSWNLTPPWITSSLVGLALVLMIAGGIRSIGFSQPFVAPDAFLPRIDRAWLRTQLAEGRPVPEERRAVVTAVAHGMVAEGRKLLFYLGLTVFYVDTIVSGERLGSLIAFSALLVWILVRLVHGAVWSRRARRWLALYA